MRNTSSKLNFLEKGITLGRELAQCNVKVLVAEAGAAKLYALDGGAAPIARSLLGIWANDGAIGLAVLAEPIRRAPARGVAVGEAILGGWADRIGLEGAVLFDGLIDRGLGERGGDYAIALGALVVDLRRLDAGDEEIVGERGGRLLGGGRGSGRHVRWWA